MSSSSGVRPPILWAIFIAVILGLGAAGGVVVGRIWEKSRSSGDTTVIRSTPSVIVAVRDLARLEGAEFRIERVVSLADKQSHFWGLIEPEDAILLVASGTVTAGVDLSMLKEGDVSIDESARTAHLTLPSSAVLSARLDNERTFVYRRDTDLLAIRHESLETRARQEAEHTLFTAAQEGGIVQRSNDAVRRTVETLLRSLGYRTVTVEYRDIAPAPTKQ